MKKIFIFLLSFILSVCPVMANESIPSPNELPYYFCFYTVWNDVKTYKIYVFDSYVAGTMYQFGNLYIAKKDNEPPSYSDFVYREYGFSNFRPISREDTHYYTNHPDVKADLLANVLGVWDENLLYEPSVPPLETPPVHIVEKVEEIIPMTVQVVKQILVVAFLILSLMVSVTLLTRLFHYLKRL